MRSQYLSLAHSDQPSWEVIAEELSSLSIALFKRFTDLSAQESSLRNSAPPLFAVFDSVPEHLQMELIDLQENDELKLKFSNMNAVDCYNSVLLKEDFPKMLAHFSGALTCYVNSFSFDFMKSKVWSLEAISRSQSALEVNRQLSWKQLKNSNNKSSAKHRHSRKKGKSHMSH